MALTYLLQELRTRRRTTVQMAGTVTAFVGLIVLIQGLSGAFLRTLEAPFRATGAHITAQRAGAPPSRFEGAILPNTHGALSPAEQQAVRDLAEVKALRPAVYFWWMQGGTLTPALGLEQLGDRRVQSGTVLVSASRTRGQSGETIQLGGHPLRVVGTFEPESVPVNVPYVIALTDARAWVAKTGATEWFNNGANLLFVEAHPGQTGPLLLSIPPLLGDNRPRDPDGDVDENAVQQRGERQVTITSTETLRKNAGGLFGLMSRFALLMTVIVGATGLLLLLKTFAASLAERRREAGILKAVGWTTGNLMARYAVESSLLGLAGGLAGLVVGGAFLWVLSGIQVTLPTPGAGGTGQPPAAGTPAPTIPLEAHLPVALAIAAVTGAVLAGLLTALLFAGRLRTIKPAEVLRYE